MSKYTSSPRQCKYRYVTADHFGKWYGTLEDAQRHSVRIGAGYLDEKSGEFFAYPGTRLETFEPRSTVRAKMTQMFAFSGDAPAEA